MAASNETTSNSKLLDPTNNDNEWNDNDCQKVDVNKQFLAPEHVGDYRIKKPEEKEPNLFKLILNSIDPRKKNDKNEENQNKKLTK